MSKRQFTNNDTPSDRLRHVTIHQYEYESDKQVGTSVLSVTFESGKNTTNAEILLKVSEITLHTYSQPKNIVTCYTMQKSCFHRAVPKRTEKSRRKPKWAEPTKGRNVYTSLLVTRLAQ
jgi:hypothetical protein